MLTEERESVLVPQLFTGVELLGTTSGHLWAPFGSKECLKPPEKGALPSVCCSCVNKLCK